MFQLLQSGCFGHRGRHVLAPVALKRHGKEQEVSLKAGMGTKSGLMMMVMVDLSKRNIAQ